MAAKKILDRHLNELTWLTKQEAMTHVNVKSEKVFDEDWKPYLNMYDNGGKGLVFKKAQIDAFMEYRKAISGSPFEMWRPRSIK